MIRVAGQRSDIVTSRVLHSADSALSHRFELTSVVALVQEILHYQTCHTTLVFILLAQLAISHLLDEHPKGWAETRHT